MMSRLVDNFRTALNAWFQQRGYSLKWMPPDALREKGLTLEINFAMLAAHLMLTCKTPYFIGIGANDGVTHDPIYPFIRDFGWEGLMVEPIPEAFDALRRNYADFKSVMLIQAAVGSADGQGTIYSVEMSQQHSMTMSLHSSFNKEILLRGKQWHPDLDAHVVERIVPVVSFSTLLAKVGSRKVNVLKIDTEGFDLEILKTIDFNKFSPELIIAEHANISRQEKIEMARILLRHNYRVTMTSLDMLAYKADVFAQTGGKQIHDTVRENFVLS